MLVRRTSEISNAKTASLFPTIAWGTPATLNVCYNRYLCICMHVCIYVLQVHVLYTVRVSSIVKTVVSYHT